jgi:hypothetical protein
MIKKSFRKVIAQLQKVTGALAFVLGCSSFSIIARNCHIR